MTIEQIESKIQAVTVKQEKAIKEIDSLRRERAKLAIDSKGEKNDEEIGRIDHQVFKLELSLSNIPAELELLEKNLATEHQRIAQIEKDKLIKQQQEVAEEIETLSAKFIEALENANMINEQLRDALLTESGIRQKTGKQILEAYCHGSMQSLSMLLEKSQREMSGIHTVPVGPGIVASGTPIQL